MFGFLDKDFLDLNGNKKKEFEETYLEFEMMEDCCLDNEELCTGDEFKTAPPDIDDDSDDFVVDYFGDDF